MQHLRALRQKKTREQRVLTHVLRLIWGRLDVAGGVKGNKLSFGEHRVAPSGDIIEISDKRSK